MIDGTIPQNTYTRPLDELAARKAETAAELATAKVAISPPTAELLPEVIPDWPIIPVELRRDILSRIIKYVEVTPGRPPAKVSLHALC